MTKSKTLFSDSIYSKKAVKAINKALSAGDSAVTTWFNCVEALEKHEGSGFDSAPRDFIFEIIIEDLKLDNWEALAALVGWKGFKDTRPKTWRGVDSVEHFDGEFSINWMEIEWIAELVGYDPCEMYSFFMQMAMDSNKEGDKAQCSYFACQGLAAMNYYYTEQPAAV